MKRLENKVAILTGAAGGQGKVEARLFAQEGARVGATDLNETLLAATVKEINDEFGTDAVLGLKHDIASESDWIEVVSKAAATFGSYGVLFLASDEARFVTGADIVMDGGYTAQ